MAETNDLVLTRGKSYSKTFYWEQEEPIVYKSITGISYASGAVRLTVTGHGIPNGWRCAVTRVVGPKQINAENNPVRLSDYRYRVTVIDPNTIEFNSVVPVDDSGKVWANWESGGFIQYFTPRSLSGITCEVVFRDKLGGTLLLSSRVSDAPLNLLTAVCDDATKTVTISVSDTAVNALTVKKGVWEAEMHGGSNGPESLVAYEDDKGNKSTFVVLGELVT